MNSTIEDLYYPCRCSTCGWKGSSKDTLGGEQIADTGDFDYLVCPKCHSRKIDEVDGPEDQVEYGYSSDSENYHGPFDTFQKAVEEGFLNDAGNMIFVGEVVPANVSDYVDAENILDAIHERASEHMGECVDDWPDMSKEERDQLEKLVCDFIEKVSPPKFWTVENVVEVTRPTDQEATNVHSS